MDFLICLIVFIAICIFIKKFFFSGEKNRNEDNGANAQRFAEVSTGRNLSGQIPQQGTNEEKAYVDICVKHASSIYEQYGKGSSCTPEDIFSTLVYFAEKIILAPSEDYAKTARIEKYITNNAGSVASELKCDTKSLSDTFKEMMTKSRIADMMTGGIQDELMNNFTMALFFLEPMVNDTNINGIIDILKSLWWEVFRTSVPPFVFENMLKPELPSNDRIIAVFKLIAEPEPDTKEANNTNSVSYSPIMEKIYKDPSSMSQKEIDETEDFLRFMGMID